VRVESLDWFAFYCCYGSYCCGFYEIMTIIDGMTFPNLLVCLAFRRKISRIFDMCVEARKCKSDCTHKFKEVRNLLRYYLRITNCCLQKNSVTHVRMIWRNV
jgi:hypothetical protein